jgi:hypothetical protein
MDGWFYSYWFRSTNEYLVVYAEKPRYQKESALEFVEISRRAAQHMIAGAKTTYTCTAHKRCNPTYGFYGCYHLWYNCRLCPFVSIALLMERADAGACTIEFENIYPIMSATIVQYLLFKKITVLDVTLKKIRFICTDEQYDELCVPTWHPDIDSSVIYEQTAIHLCQALSVVDLKAASIIFAYPPRLQDSPHGASIKKQIDAIFALYKGVHDGNIICVTGPKGFEWTRLVQKFMARPSFERIRSAIYESSKIPTSGVSDPEHSPAPSAPPLDPPA